MGRTESLNEDISAEAVGLAESILQRVEWDQNDPSVMENVDQWCASSDVARFYAGRHVLVTGATGYMGIALVEKLLRACPDIAAIYIIIRPKRGLNIHQRVEKIINGELFDRLRRLRGKSCFRPVVPIAGDVAEINLGLSPEDSAMLASRVEVIFHSAANVRFNESLSAIVKTNIRGTRYLIELAQRAKQLKAFVHISTAYSNCIHKHVEEIFYPPAMDPHKLIEVAENAKPEDLVCMTQKMVDVYPNTYTFTKQVTEDLVKNSGLPSCVYRPGVVTPASEDPIPGWTKSLGGTMSFIMGLMLGFIRCGFALPNLELCFVPLDQSVAGMIACAWDVARTQSLTEPSPTVFNNVSNRNPITWGNFVNLTNNICREVPSIKSMWLPGATMIESVRLEAMVSFVIHLVPALFIDAFLLATRRKQRMLQIYSRIYFSMSNMRHFCENDWHFADDNYQRVLDSMSKADRLAFPMDIRSIDWTEYMRRCVLGVRVYLCGDSMSTLPAARMRNRKFILPHFFIKYTTILLLLLAFWSALSGIVNRRIRAFY